MSKQDRLKRFEKLIEDEPSNFLDKFQEIKKNKEWLDKSAKIAIKILVTLKAKKWTQKDLALKLKVSPQQINKIVKGKENLTLETICKLESALDITFVDTFDFSDAKNIKVNATKLNFGVKIKEEISIDINKVLKHYRQYKTKSTKKTTFSVEDMIKDEYHHSTNKYKDVA